MRGISDTTGNAFCPRSDTGRAYLRVRDLLAKHKLACSNCDGPLDCSAHAAPC